MTGRISELENSILLGSRLWLPFMGGVPATSARKMLAAGSSHGGMCRGGCCGREDGW